MTETSVTETLTFYLDYNSLKTVRSLCTSVLTDGRHSQSGSQHPGVENMFNRTEEKVVHITGMFLKVFYLNLHLSTAPQRMGLFLQRYISLLSPLSLNPLKLDKRESIHFYNHFVEVDTQEIVVFGSKGWLMYSPTHRALTFLSLCCSCHLLKLDGFPSQVCPQEHLEHPFPAPSPPCRGTIQ